MKFIHILKSVMPIFVLALVVGCATQVVETPSPITPATQKLGQYTQVILVQSELAGIYAGQAPNIKAATKIDEILGQQLAAQYANLETVTLDAARTLAPAASGEKVLVIRPLIKQIKFIGGAARFWAGAMAGSSVVIMDTAFIDHNSGQRIANPGFSRRAGAYADPFGVGSNLMLEDVAKDVSNYSAMNK
jgi:hypothetical protein